MRKSRGSLRIIDSVEAHIKKFIGPYDLVLHEKESPHVHIDVHIVEPTRERPYFTLVTSGMSERPMPIPEEVEDGRYAELMICLPADWPMTSEAFNKEENWWPIRLLKGLALYPHANKTWFGLGHTIDWSDPPETLGPNTRMTAAVLLSPRLVPREARIIHIDKKRHAFLWAVYPVYPEELELKLRDGSDRLAQLFEERGITELLDMRRPSVAHVN